jgi:hypothetical protein
MGHGRKPGSQTGHGRHQGLDDGTSARHASPQPGPTGMTTPDFDHVISNLGGTLSEWSTSAGNWIHERSETVAAHTKSALLTLIDLAPVKTASPVSTALLKHYVERSGDPYPLGDIPGPWQDWIVGATHGRSHKNLDPYNAGLYDLRNSLGHFDVEVTSNGDGTKTYLISDTYEFTYIKHDKAQRGRHGFPLGDLSPRELAIVRALLPSDTYKNPGGFRERWEIKVIGKDKILFIPQQYLAGQGKPFKVTGSFIR